VTSGNGITISADKVAIDLNGFTISSTAASATGTAILLNGTHTNIAILNGFIMGGVTVSGGVYSGPGFANGINFTSTPSNVRVSDISVSGCLTFGINLGFNSTVVKSCVVNTVGSYGIYTQSASDSTAVNCGFDGFQVNTAENCTGASSAGTGVYANNTALNCSGSSSSTYGLYGGVASNCLGITTSGDDGLLAVNATNCYGYNAGSGVGLGATSAQNCYGQSVAGTGLNATNATGCYGLSSSGRGVNADVASGCRGQSNSNSSYGLASSFTASNCYGVSSGGTGLFAWVAIGCYGSSIGGTGLNGFVAVGCYGEGNFPNAFAHKYFTGIGPDS
jgi:hypothetical protein